MQGQIFKVMKLCNKSADHNMPLEMRGGRSKTVVKIRQYRSHAASETFLQGEFSEDSGDR